MLYTAYSFKYGQRLAKPEGRGSTSCIRLYTLEELREILGARGLEIKQTYGGYETSLSASEDRLALVIHSQKVSR